MRRITIVCILTILQASAPVLADDAPAETAGLSSENETRTIVCNGAEASIAGNRNTVTFTGSCVGLRIRGEANSVSVALAAGALIDIEGNHNRVRFTAAKGISARLRLSGNFTEVTPGANSAAPAADTATIAGDDQRLELDCAGRAVTLQGTRSRFVLHGGCTALTVRGEANTVRAELAAGAQVLVEGNTIALTYTVRGGGAEPQLSVLGMGSSATREGSRPVNSGSAPVAVQGPASVPLLMHDLEGSVVATGTLVKLPKAVFADDRLTVSGEAQLAKLVVLIGQISPVGLRISGSDPDVAVASRHQQLVRDWLEGHGANGLFQMPAVEVGEAEVDVLMLR